MSMSTFTYKKLETHYRDALAAGYSVVTCKQYVEMDRSLRGRSKILINRIDVDFSLRKCRRILDIFGELEIKGTFFIRLHADEYNPFSYENYRILKLISEAGHEIGLHSEVIDESNIWGEPAIDCLMRDLAVLKEITRDNIFGVASHGGNTGFNNLDFWKDRSASEFGLLYEAYDKSESFGAFHESLYISDSDWTQWKSFRNGLKQESDKRNLSEHVNEGEKLIYLLIHPDTFYESHFYE